MLELLLNVDLHAPSPRGVCHVLVANGRIAHISAELPDLGSAVAVARTDLEGRRVIPGIVDGHVHVTGGGGEAGPATSVPALPLSAFTTAGVTSVVGLLGTDDTVRTTAGLLARTRALRQEGLSAWCLTGGYHLPAQTLTGSVRDDIVHLGPVIGVGELAISDHRSSQPTLDELLRLAADVHTAGLLADKAGVVHLHVGDGERGLSLVRDAIATSELPASVLHPTHVNRRRGLFDEALDLPGTGVTIDVTAFPVADDEDAWSAPAALGRYLDAGADRRHITVSSDAGGSLPVFDADGRVVGLDVGRPGELIRTIAALVGDGRALADVLPAFTTNPARQFRLRGKGTIEVGADADLVVLDDDHSPRDVMARGRWHVRDRVPVLRGTFEKEPRT